MRGDGVDLAVREWGEAGAEPVLLVHGYPDDSGVWLPVAQRLAERFHVVAYDTRGAGRSDAPTATSDYRFEHLMADMAAVIDAVSPDQPVHLVGHDWGSVQGWEAITVDQLQGRIASFTSISGPSLDHVGRWARHARLGAALRQGVKSWYVYLFHVPGLVPLGWRTGTAWVWPKLIERLEGVTTDDDWPGPHLAADGANGVRLYRANVRDRVLHPRPQHSDVPVQLIVPTQDRFVTPALLDGLESVPSTFRRREVPAGHWVVRAKPDAVARWVTEHVEAVAAGTAGDEPSRLVVITGTGSGIGRSTALAFARAGARVVGADIDGAAADRTAELCRIAGAPGAVAYVVDVGDADAMESFAKSVQDDHGVPDVVVLNAGIGMAGPMLDTSVDDWEKVLHVNLWGVVHGARLFGRQMVDRAEGGHIVTTASAAAFFPSRTLPAYSTTKAAVLMLTESLGAELASEGIGTSAICPGFADTGIAAATRYVGLDESGQAEQRRRAGRLFKRMALSPDRVAAAVLDAVENQRPVVTVGFEARLARLGSRFTPGAVRRLARIDLLRKSGGGQGPPAPQEAVGRAFAGAPAGASTGELDMTVPPQGLHPRGPIVAGIASARPVDRSPGGTASDGAPVAVSTDHPIKARRVAFDWEATPLHWVPGDVQTTHTINVLHLLLPAGEKWFVDVYREALPRITDDRLRDDVRGFMGQEAVHSRAHQSVLDHLAAQGIETNGYTDKVDWLFERALGTKPFGRHLPTPLRRHWLMFRLALIAAIEQFTAVLGDWVLDAEGLEEAGADPVMVDLLRWHGAEEVEHRSVAFDLYQHLHGGYALRVVTMAEALFTVVLLWVLGVRYFVRHDPTRPRKPTWRAFRRAGRAGRLPTVGFLWAAVPRYLRRDHHPSREGSTEKALAYLASSPAAQAAATAAA
ncbi:MAG: SDR family oxidoreductase [Acidimicrobiia bacterium]